MERIIFRNILEQKDKVLNKYDIKIFMYNH